MKPVGLTLAAVEVVRESRYRAPLKSPAGFTFLDRSQTMNIIELEKIDELMHNLSLLNLSIEGAAILLEDYTGNKEYSAALVEQVSLVHNMLMEAILGKIPKVDAQH